MSKDRRSTRPKNIEVDDLTPDREKGEEDWKPLEQSRVRDLP